MSEIITNFFIERKASWLKARLKPSLAVEEQSQLQQEAEEKFSLANWLPDAAKRASQLSMVSHPGKFSHPSAKTSSIIAKVQQENDGYLRSGNVEYELDVFGNAAAMDVYKFLSLPMDDGQTILAHLENDSPAIKSVFSIPTASYENLKEGLLSIKQLDNSNKTDHLVKQVYFPVDDAYHLLSLLTPSGLLTQVKNRIDAMRFSDETKQAKENRRKNEFHEAGYDDVFDLTVTAYGGTQPQNVSVLNSQNAGRAYLLQSLPPVLEHRKIRLPTRDFFKNSLRIYQFKEDFQSLDKLIRAGLGGVNNIHLREGVKNRLKYIVDSVLFRVRQIRDYDPGWSDKENYQSLPFAQRIWLDDAYLEQRENQEEWLEDIVGNFARWILDSYDFLFKESKVNFSDDEFREISLHVIEAVNDDREFFK